MNTEQRGNDQERLKQPSRLKLPEMAGQNQNHLPQQQPPPPQKCPRCDSSNTKFCYYNNYSLSQPRYFCKNCRRYWTHGGTLRNVPVGGGYRKSKRPKPSVPSPSRTLALPPAASDPSQPLRPLPPVMTNTIYNGGSFLSSLAAMHSLSAGINQPTAVNLGGGSNQYDPNMTLLQGVGLQSMKPPPPPPQQYSWTQSFINRSPAADTTAASAAASSFWSGATSDRNNQGGSSFDPNHWQDSSNQGFDP